MSALAPLVIIVGVVLLAVGGLWLIGAAMDDDGSSSSGFGFWILGLPYLLFKLGRRFVDDPAEAAGAILPGVGFLVAGGLITWLGTLMLG